MNGAQLVQGRTRTAVRGLKWVFGVLQWVSLGAGPVWVGWLIVQARRGAIEPLLPKTSLIPQSVTSVTVTLADGTTQTHATVAMGYFVGWLAGILLSAGLGWLMFRALQRLCAAIEAGEFFTFGNLVQWRTVLRAAAGQWVLGALGGRFDASALLLLVSGYVLAVLFKYGIALQADNDTMI